MKNATFVLTLAFFRDCLRQQLSDTLTFLVTDPEFRFFFSQFGELQESVVMFDRETRRSRGFGFVTYVDPVSALTTIIQLKI